VTNELEVGLRAVAVPLCDRRDRIVAALTVSLHASDYSADDIRYTVVPTLQAAARAIKADVAQA